MASHTILVIGRGGREHVLAWKLAQSPRVQQVWCAPGNGGTALAGGKVANVDLQENDFASLLDFAQGNSVTLTVVGPEAPLAGGIVDAFQAAGLRCFGPSKAAAQIEASKAFAKDFMVRHGIPTARFAAFTDFNTALAHLRRIDYPIVLKASGLAAGKGVILPASLAEAEAALRQIMVAREFGAAGDIVVIEERLAGPEASVLAWSDGRTVALMPAAQDHKRVFDGDQGPNTGGMGAYAPAPLMTPALLDAVRRTVLQPAIDGLAAEGRPYVGVIYAGMMLTADGPTTLEFNCRLGDPETQVILPLLESDLVDVIEACLDGRLAELDVRWRAGAAATVVAASEGYPGSYPKAIPKAVGSPAWLKPWCCRTLLCSMPARGWRTTAGCLPTADACWPSPAWATTCRPRGIERIHFQGMHYRRDIGAKADVG